MMTPRDYEHDVMTPRTMFWSLLDRSGAVAGVFLLVGWATVSTGFGIRAPLASALMIIVGIALTLAGPAFFYLTPNMARWSRHPATQLAPPRRRDDFHARSSLKGKA
jgi:hypothetical protein